MITPEQIQEWRELYSNGLYLDRAGLYKEALPLLLDEVERFIPKPIESAPRDKSLFAAIRYREDGRVFNLDPFYIYYEEGYPDHHELANGEDIFRPGMEPGWYAVCDTDAWQDTVTLEWLAQNYTHWFPLQEPNCGGKGVVS